MMQRKFIFITTSLIIFLNLGFLQAQDKHNYTDHKPEYRKWLDSYILDKIEYKPSSTIFYFRFVCDNTQSGGATFYPPGGEYPWYLKGKGVSKEFDITAVKNIRRNGELVMDNVVGEPFHTSPAGTTGNTIFSCEVHFPRLDDDMKEADFIEGRGQEFNTRHFNCFNVKLKTWNDETLGSEDDSKKVVENFEKKYTGTTTNPTNDNPQTEVVKENEDEDDKKYSPGTRRLHSKKDLVCNDIIILDKVKFHDNSTKFKGMVEANEALNLVFEYMRQHPKSTLKLYGHSDVFGPEDRNMELSKQRVIKIQRWLTMYGIKAHRIDYEWFGPKQPLKPEGDIINRRVEIKINCNE